MSVEKIIKSLEILIVIHEDLIGLSKQKTDIVKEGSVEKLQQVLIKERKHIQLLEQAEVRRIKAVDKWILQQGLQMDSATITNMLANIADERVKEELENTTITLTMAITALKQQEQLNQALIHQSMQFVQLSLDMMNPTLKNMNYGIEKGNQTTERSVFDSKA